MLSQDNFYHIYHRGVNQRNIFLSIEDFEYFIAKYKFYLFPAVDTYSYVLLNNHFHFLIRVRSEVEQNQLFNTIKKRYKPGSIHHDQKSSFKFYNPSLQIGHLLNFYTKFFNKKYNSSGVLFDGRFKRIEITGNQYLNYLVCYIHRNPIHHNIATEYSEYRFSSFNAITSNRKTLINKDFVLSLFGNTQNYISAHQEVKNHLENKYTLE